MSVFDARPHSQWFRGAGRGAGPDGTWPSLRGTYLRPWRTLSDWHRRRSQPTRTWQPGTAQTVTAWQLPREYKIRLDRYEQGGAPSVTLNVGGLSWSS